MDKVTKQECAGQPSSSNAEFTELHNVTPTGLLSPSPSGKPKDAERVPSKSLQIPETSQAQSLKSPKETDRALRDAKALELRRKSANSTQIDNSELLASGHSRSSNRSSAEAPEQSRSSNRSSRDSEPKEQKDRGLRDAKLLQQRRRNSDQRKNGKEAEPSGSGESVEQDWAPKQSLKEFDTKLDNLLSISEKNHALLESAVSKLNGVLNGKTQISTVDDSSNELAQDLAKLAQDLAKGKIGEPPKEQEGEGCDIFSQQFALPRTSTPTFAEASLPVQEVSRMISDATKSQRLRSPKRSRSLYGIELDGSRLSIPQRSQSGANWARESGKLGQGNIHSSERRPSNCSIRTSDRRNSNGERRSSMVSWSSAILRTMESASKRHPILYNLWRFLEEPLSVKYGTYFIILMNFTIIVSVLFAFLQLTEPGVAQSRVTTGIDMSIDILFTVETVLRFVACPNRLLFFTRFFNVIDIFAGLPPLVLRVVDLTLSEGDKSEFMENILLCIVPLLRLLKFMRWFEKFHLLLKAFELLLDALPVLLYPLACILLAFAALLYLVEPRSNIPTLGWSIYATLLTLTTVGYGDVTPKSDWGHFLMCCLSIVSTLYLAMPLGIIGGAFSTVWQDRDRLLLLQRTRTQLKEMGLTAQDIPSLFRFFDKDLDGQLSVDEFSQMVRVMRIGLSSGRVLDLFKMMDKDGSGRIDDEEFMATLFPVTHAALYHSNAFDGAMYESEISDITQSRTASKGASYRESTTSAFTDSEGLAKNDNEAPALAKQPAHMPGSVYAVKEHTEDEATSAETGRLGEEGENTS